MTHAMDARDRVLVTWSEGVLIATLNRPDKLNALDWPTIDRLLELLDEIEADDQVRVIILTGAGERAFSAGADIASIRRDISEPEVALREFVARGQRLTHRIEHFSKPVIAAVNGLAFGGGCEVVESCHLALAAETATFAKPEIRLGFPPTFGGTQRLPRLIGRKRALRMLLTTEPIDAAEAKAIGLVNEVVPAPELMQAATTLARSIAAFDAPTVAATLTAVARGADLPIEEALAVEASQFARVAWRPEVRDRLDAFLDRRGRK